MLPSFRGKKNMHEPKELSRLFGVPGEAVPEVDPEDMKAVWREYEDAKKDCPPGQRCVGITMRVLEPLCKPGADMRAVCYRQTQLDLLRLLSEHKLFSEVAEVQDQMSEFHSKITALMTDGSFSDGAFRAMAKVPMEWMQVGVVRDGLPYDFAEFLRLCQ
jgi:hypothetical protein